MTGGFDAGYVGLVAATCLDVDEERVAGLTEGPIPVYEPGLLYRGFGRG